MILILHGPNMNLIGLRSAKTGMRITLDKINRALRRQVRESDITLKILQTHDEAKAVTFIQRNRNKANGLIISPGPWHRGGYTLADTLAWVEIPFVTVSFEPRETTLFHGIHSVVCDNPVTGYTEALEKLAAALSLKGSKI